MAQQTINLGTTANDGTGDTLELGGTKINENFSDLYSRLFDPASPPAFGGTAPNSASFTALTVTGSAIIPAGRIDGTKIGSVTPSTGAFTTLTANNGTSGQQVVTYSQTANAVPIAATASGASETSISVSTGTFTAPSAGALAIIVRGYTSGAGFDTSQPVVTTSVAGYVSLVASSGGYDADGFGYLPMAAGQSTTISATATASATGNMRLSIFAYFQPMAA